MTFGLALSSLRLSIPQQVVLNQVRKAHSLAPARRRAAAPRPHLHRARAMSGSAGGDYVQMIGEKNAANAVVVYSKTYCPYCSEVKSLFQRLGVEAKVLELDEIADGGAVQDALGQVTGRRTVPQVFVGGTHVGGCDDTLAAQQSGKLAGLLEAAGVKANL